jgi:hypothetical protein
MNRFAFFHDLNLIIHEYGEQIDDDSLMQHLLAVYDHPDFRVGMDVLSSFARTRQLGVTAEGLRQIARISSLRREPAGNFVAVVAGSKAGHGLSRLYSAHADREGTVTTNIFRSEAAAADWLDEVRGRAKGTTAAVVEQMRSGRDSAPP